MSTNTNPFQANWTAQGHTLCLGYWEIFYKGKPIELPERVKENHMGTFGIFSWVFPDDEDFAEGLVLAQWIDQNSSWLLDAFQSYSIPFDEFHLANFYDAVNKSDWRCGSCGGCL